MNYMRIIKATLCFLSLLGFTQFTLYSQASTNAGGQEVNAITTAVPFLLISPDSRHGALGEAGVAIANDANATHWNLSTLAFADKVESLRITSH